MSDSPPPSPETPPSEVSTDEVAKSLEESRAALEKIESRSAEAEAALAAYDAFAKEHGIEPGVGDEALAGDDAFHARKAVFEELIFQLEHLDTRVEEIAEDLKPSKPKPSIRARAVGNRFRI